jgi:hypothetical protein
VSERSPFTYACAALHGFLVHGGQNLTRFLGWLLGYMEIGRSGALRYSVDLG